MNRLVHASCSRGKSIQTEADVGELPPPVALGAFLLMRPASLLVCLAGGSGSQPVSQPALL